MKRNIVIFLFLIVVVTGLLFIGRKRHSAATNGGASEVKISQADFKGKPAPDFELETLDGKKLRLSDLKGKAVLLNFWATWCSPCKEELPWFVDLQKDYGAQGLQVVGVAMDDAGKDKIEEFAKKMGVNYPVVLGKEKVAEQYGGVEFLPTTFYIDRSGNISERVFGIVDRKEAEDNVKKVLASASPNGAPLNTVPNSEVPNRAAGGTQR